MSKSKKNIVDPEKMINQYGADTVRLFILFAAPPERDLEWNPQGVEGAHRFLQRIWRLIKEISPSLNNKSERKNLDEGEKLLYRKTHQTIKKVTEDIERFHFNTAISALMEFFNVITDFVQKNETKRSLVLKDAIEKFVILLSPFVPHITEELWHLMGHKTWLQWKGQSKDAGSSRNF